MRISRAAILLAVTALLSAWGDARAANPERAERRCEKVVAKLSAKFLRGALRDAKPAAALFADAVGNACPDDVVAFTLAPDSRSAFAASARPARAARCSGV